MAGIEDGQFRKILENNILANHWLIGFVAPQMLERKDGSIIIVSSIGGLRGSPVLGAYCVSKAADLQLARNLAVEYGPSNVRVNCIAPGLIKTDFARALWEDPEALKLRSAEHAAAAHRRAGRDRRRGDLPRLAGRVVRDRAGDRRRRRRDDLIPGAVSLQAHRAHSDENEDQSNRTLSAAVPSDPGERSSGGARDLPSGRMSPRPNRSSGTLSAADPGGPRVLRLAAVRNSRGASRSSRGATASRDSAITTIGSTAGDSSNVPSTKC